MVVWARMSQSTDSSSYHFPLTLVVYPHSPRAVYMHQSTISKKASFKIKKCETKDHHIWCLVWVHIWSNFKIIFLKVCHFLSLIICGSSHGISTPDSPSFAVCSFVHICPSSLPLSLLSPFNSTPVPFDPLLISNSERPLRKGEGRKTKG